MNADFLKMLRGDTPNNIGELRVIKAVTSDPYPITFVMQGTETALDADIFTIPLCAYPICEGDTFYVLPIAGSDKQRWGIVEKINNTNATGVMTSATSCQVKGIGRPYTSSELLIPPYVASSNGTGARALRAGDRVILFPVAVNGTVKYAVANYY